MIAWCTLKAEIVAARKDCESCEIFFATLKQNIANIKYQDHLNIAYIKYFLKRLHTLKAARNYFPKKLRALIVAITYFE